MFLIRQIASLSYHDLFSCNFFQELIVAVRPMKFWLFVIVMELLLYTSLIIIVRTSFGLDSKTGLDSGPTSLNNEFVEHGRKN